MKIRNLYESQLTSEHVKGGLDSFYQLTKAKRLAKADGHDYDKLPEYDRGADQPHKEKYRALAKEVKENIDDQYELFIDGRPQTKLYNIKDISAVQKQLEMKFPKAKIEFKKVNQYAFEDEVDTGPTWKDDLEAALDGYPESEHDTIKDGTCPECGGNGYSDGDEYDDDGEENSECNGMYDYDCDEGEIRDNTWADELKRNEPKEPKQPAPSKEQIMKLLPMLHKEYVQSGRYNAFELGSILKQMYPELNKREAGSYVADFLSNYKPEVESIEEAEKSIEDCIRQTLEKEGGAAGKGAIVDACKEAGYSEEECSDAMSKMSDVKEHEHGDYILEVTEGLYDEGENADTQTNEEEELNNLRKRAGLEVKEVIEDDYEYENDLAMEFVKLPLASMSKEEIRREMSSIFNTLYQMGMGDEPQTDAGVAMEDLGTSVEDSGHYVNDDWTYPSEGEISDEDVQTMIEHQQKVKDVISLSGLEVKEDEGKSTENKIKGMINYHQSEVDDAETDDSIKAFDHEDAVQWYEDLLQDHKKTGEDTFEAPFGGDTAWREMIQQEMEELKLYKPQEAFRGIDNLPEELNDLRKRAGLEVKERYKDVGVADTVKDQRGKEFQFDKSTKKFKSLDGEEAAVNTKLGKDLLRLRRNQMKKSTPSYNR